MLFLLCLLWVLVLYVGFPLVVVCRLLGWVGGLRVGFVVCLVLFVYYYRFGCCVDLTGLVFGLMLIILLLIVLV